MGNAQLTFRVVSPFQPVCKTRADCDDVLQGATEGDAGDLTCQLIHSSIIGRRWLADIVNDRYAELWCG